MARREAVIVDTVRTPIGKRNGALSTWHPTDLLGFTLNALIDRTGVDPGRVDDVVGGCVSQVGEQSNNVARNAWIAGGLPWHVPATSVDRQCGSSQQAVHFVAQGVIAGAYDLGIACGVESMTRTPMGSNASGGTGPFSGQWIEAVGGRFHPTQFEVSQILAERYGITREDMDAYSAESHRRAQENWDNGHFAKETVPVPIKDEEGAETGARASTGTRASAPRAPSSRWPSCRARRRGTRLSPPTSPRATPPRPPTAPRPCSSPSAARPTPSACPTGRSSATSPWPPRTRGSCCPRPSPATRKLLERSGMTVDRFDSVECNEAFAAIALMWAREFQPEMTATTRGVEPSPSAIPSVPAVCG